MKYGEIVVQAGGTLLDGLRVAAQRTLKLIRNVVFVAPLFGRPRGFNRTLDACMYY